MAQPAPPGQAGRVRMLVGLRRSLARDRMHGNAGENAVTSERFLISVGVGGLSSSVEEEWLRQ